jgi:ABC-type sugar transport system ATPase subunit
MELVGLCDRVTVMYEHRAVATFEGSQVSEANLVHASVVGGNRK